MRRLAASLGAATLVIVAAAWARSDNNQAGHWSHFVDGSGFRPSLVFSCSERGASRVVVIRYEEGQALADSANTPWGAGEAVQFESHVRPCDCTPTEGETCRPNP